MNRQELSLIAHRRHPIACPFDDRKVARLIEELDPSRAATALDIGCGQGEWLSRLLSQYAEIRGVGIDQSSWSLDAARRRTAHLEGRIELRQVDASQYAQECSDTFDIIFCAGSTHALGGYHDALSKTQRLLTPRGRLLVAEGYWQVPPSAAAMAALDAKPTDFSDLEGTIKAAIDAGFTPLYVATSNQDEWDDYEWSWCGSLERHAVDHPQEEAREMIEAARSHRDGYIRGYRGSLGFAALVLQQA